MRLHRGTHMKLLAYDELSLSAADATQPGVERSQDS